MRALAMSTGGGMDFWVLTDRSLDIGPSGAAACPSPGSAAGFSSPTLHDAEADGAPASTAASRAFSSHAGSIMSASRRTASAPRPLPFTPARVVAYGEDWDADEPFLFGEGEAVQGHFSGDCIVLRRRIEAPIGGSRLRLRDRVVNIGPEPAALRILYHVNFGFPAIGPDTRVELDGQQVHPAPGAAGPRSPATAAPRPTASAPGFSAATASPYHRGTGAGAPLRAALVRSPAAAQRPRHRARQLRPAGGRHQCRGADTRAGRGVDGRYRDQLREAPHDPRPAPRPPHAARRRPRPPAVLRRHPQPLRPLLRPRHARGRPRQRRAASSTSCRSPATPTGPTCRSTTPRSPNRRLPRQGLRPAASGLARPFRDAPGRRTLPAASPSFRATRSIPPPTATTRSFSPTSIPRRWRWPTIPPPSRLRSAGASATAPSPFPTTSATGSARAGSTGGASIPALSPFVEMVSMHGCAETSETDRPVSPFDGPGERPLDDGARAAVRPRLRRRRQHRPPQRLPRLLRTRPDGRLRRAPRPRRHLVGDAGASHQRPHRRQRPPPRRARRRGPGRPRPCRRAAASLSIEAARAGSSTAST